MCRMLLEQVAAKPTHSPPLFIHINAISKLPNPLAPQHISISSIAIQSNRSTALYLPIMFSLLASQQRYNALPKSQLVLHNQITLFIDSYD
ncbi:uncharacterized protein EAE97_010933 [Botrytis byssoidea]|uniref:Uncharacterized protein n=1 Tax=Botrytis byssoidea TaxID=139641 RepID=A0A9P5HU45_9HELO|nr:uncharacterized protein EAE97_010933 [Botrytis byssoidea]KAF7922769.1 hypothetical protein EAE97_010933 [Botrytis byssoidea]